MTNLIFLLLIASPARTMPSDEPLIVERAPRICDEYLVPPRARSLVQRVDATRDREGLVEAVSQKVIAAAQRRESLEFETKGYLIELRARVARRRVAVTVRKTLNLRRYASDVLPAHSLRSPILDVWRGISLGALELARQNPSVHLVTIKGQSMYDDKFKGLIARRLGFRSDDFETSQIVFLWRPPGEDASLWHQIEFAARGPSEYLRKF